MGPRSDGGHHLQTTASMLAKQRRKVGEADAASGLGQVRSIDGLLLAMKRRLRAVQAAMAEAAADEQQVEPPAEAAGGAAGEAAAGGAAPAAGCGEYLVKEKRASALLQAFADALREQQH